MRYFLETYGCQMNKAESAALEAMLAERSWLAAGEAGEADLVVINTCSVRITAENRAWGRIAHFAAMKRQRDFTLVVVGCMAERLREGMRARAPAIDYVLGTFQKSAFGLVLDAIAEGRRLEALEESPSYVFSPSHREPGSFSSFVPIMHGCDNFCSYCIVPYVRGRELSREPRAVLAEIASLSAAGVKELTLLGQNVNSYRWNGEGGELGFAGLLELIARSPEAEGIGRIRFLSSHPKDLSPETVDVIARHPVFARHIHLCVQHGSDAILERMNRRYTAAQYLALAELIRSRLPGATLSTDILIGFPGETEADVEATLALMREVRFAYAYMYHYNPREGTPAASMPDRVPDAVKKERLGRVIALQKELSRELMRGLVGSEATVLVEGASKRRADELVARTDQDLMAVFPAAGARVGEFARVRLTGVRGATFRAEEIR